MGYDEKRDEIVEGLSDELFNFLDSTGFKLIETRTGENCEATFGSKHIIAGALADAMNPFLKKAFDLGSGNGGATVCKAEDKKEERLRRPVRFIEGALPPKKPKRKATVSQTMLDDSGTNILGIKIITGNDLICRIGIDDLAEIAGQAADVFVIEHLKSKGFDLNKEIYRENDIKTNEMVYRQWRR